jgi:hypothetical protein
MMAARLDDKTETNQARTEANHEMMTKLDAQHERVKASVNAW